MASYVNRMCLRMLVPSVLPVAIGGVLCVATRPLAAWPAKKAVFAAMTALPESLFVAGAAVAASYAVYQLFRLYRWETGVGDACYVCGCLLGNERNGYWGVYRKCLGCGKSHTI